MLRPFVWTERLWIRSRSRCPFDGRWETKRADPSAIWRRRSVKRRWLELWRWWRCAPEILRRLWRQSGRRQVLSGVWRRAARQRIVDSGVVVGTSAGAREREAIPCPQKVRRQRWWRWRLQEAYGWSRKSRRLRSMWQNGVSRRKGYGWRPSLAQSVLQMHIVQAKTRFVDPARARERNLLQLMPRRSFWTEGLWLWRWSWRFVAHAMRHLASVREPVKLEVLSHFVRHSGEPRLHFTSDIAYPLFGDTAVVCLVPESRSYTACSISIISLSLRILLFHFVFNQCVHLGYSHSI